MVSEKYIGRRVIGDILRNLADAAFENEYLSLLS